MLERIKGMTVGGKVLAWEAREVYFRKYGRYGEVIRRSKACYVFPRELARESNAARRMWYKRRVCQMETRTRDARSLYDEVLQ